MNILIVDDNLDKISRVTEAIESVSKSSKLDISVAKSVIDAKELLKSRMYDLLIVDQYLPLREADEPQSDGGTRLLRDIQSRSEYSKPGHIVGLTEYSNLEAFRLEFERQLWSIIPYNTSSNEWRERLLAKIRYISEWIKLSQNQATSKCCDVAVITALANPEFKQLLNTRSWDQFQSQITAMAYKRTFVAKSGSITSYALCQPQMGIAASATITTQIIAEYKPRIIAMTGISAGNRQLVNIGDLIVADPCWDWGSGKILRMGDQSVFLPDPQQERLQPMLRSAFQDLSLNSEFLRKVWESYSGDKPPDPPRIIIGPLASGAAVVSDAIKIEEIKTQHRKLLGIEMEGYGVMYATRQSSNSISNAIVMKSVCDFGDNEKSDNFQNYCSYVSASAFNELLEKYI